jgi:arsenate reductase
MIEAAILRSQRPRHILFLCVANAIRSQIAEGVARSLAPHDVGVSSAGSYPSRVHPDAIEVMQEIGIDISNQFSKSVSEIGGSSVDAVITLCADEVCPVYLRKVLQIHWGLPDPFSQQSIGTTKLEAFRRVRDELLRRLKLLFRPI